VAISLLPVHLWRECREATGEGQAGCGVALHPSSLRRTQKVRLTPHELPALPAAFLQGCLCVGLKKPDTALRFIIRLCGLRQKYASLLMVRAPCLRPFYKVVCALD